jgi:prepilin-type N-terminal cleavage/methylation domain-containing protein
MWISNIKKHGNTLIEVIIAVTVFSILIMSALSVEAAKTKIKARNERKQYYNECVKLLKSNMINQISYNDFKNMFEYGESLYVASENITLESFKELGFEEIVQYSEPVEGTFLEINILGEKPVKIIIRCHINNFLMNEVITWEFFKGSYT